MKTKTNVILLFFFLLIKIAYSQEGHLKNTNWKKENLKGNIKSFEETYPRSSYLGKYKYIFNKKGLLIEKNKYNYKGELSNKRTYKYDKDYNRIEFLDCSYSNNKCTREKYTYTIKDSHKIVRNYVIREWMPEDGKYVREKWIYFYKNKLLIKAESYIGEDELISEIRYTYDNKNNLIEEYNIYNQQESSNSKYHSKYDSKGRLIEYANNEKIISYSYDKNDNVIEKKYFFPKDKIENIITYKYKYDKKGNWKRCKEYKYNKLIFIEKRRYKYFD